MYLQIVVVSTPGEGSLVQEVPLTPWQYFSYGLFIGVGTYVMTLRPFYSWIKPHLRIKPAEFLAINVLIQGFFYLILWHANGYVSGHATFILGGIAGAAILSGIHKLVIENSVREDEEGASPGKSGKHDKTG